MAVYPDRPLRADAARNVERLVRAARTVYAAAGPDALLEDVARHAGVGARTLYRHFPTKADLVRAALEQSLAEDLAPAMMRALADDDPYRGLVSLVEAALSMASREFNTLAAAKHAGSLTADLSSPFFEALSTLTERAQQAGRIRGDLVADDLRRIMAMLFSVLWTMDPESDGWRRYLGLVLDSLSPPAASSLPAAPILRYPSRPHGWPI
ncbi:TetR/AcrR family transcriptional regulator [Nocardia sp. CA-120079]|uniref:TetR/AcrR family transcriptional regulator n=1 Tax=Nocardia sp. CA-120079 TaxID=3239974 RepID=UPI003D957839